MNLYSTQKNSRILAEKKIGKAVNRKNGDAQKRVGTSKWKIWGKCFSAFRTDAIHQIPICISGNYSRTMQAL